MDSKKIQGNEYEKTYYPLGGFVMVKKDVPPKSVGKIIMPETVRGEDSKFTTTGVIVRKSLFAQFEDAYTAYLWDVLKEGDRVGFSNTVPLYSPSPPFWQFEGEDKEAYVTIHVKDILAVIVSPDENAKRYMDRFHD